MIFPALAVMIATTFDVATLKGNASADSASGGAEGVVAALDVASIDSGPLRDLLLRIAAEGS